MTHYDVIVIGAGSGNSIIDDEFAKGRRCALVQSGTFGGTCLNAGCIPTKMFVYPADLAHNAAHAGERLGVRTTFEAADWVAMRDRIFGRIDAIEAGGREYRVNSELADCYVGTAKFVDAHTLQIALDDGGSAERSAERTAERTAESPAERTAEISGDQIVIAAGGRPVVPNIPGLDQVTYHTSDTVMRLDELPARVGILGGGYIGSEFAHVFSAFGAEVVQIHRQPVLLNHHDQDIAARFTEVARGQWGVELSATLSEVAPAEDGAIELTITAADGTVSQRVVDVLLIAAGRRPNSDTLDVAAAGVRVDEHDCIVVDEFQRSSVPHIWALGDICHTVDLKHVANHEARVVRHNLMQAGGLESGGLESADHRYVPAAVFSHPQVASVGMTQAEAEAAGCDVAVKIQAYGDTAYGWAMEDQQHFVKLIADRATGKLVGAHLMGPMASVLIQPLIQAMSFEQPVVGLARAQYWIHPALSEVVENALLGLEEAMGTGG